MAKLSNEKNGNKSLISLDRLKKYLDDSVLFLEKIGKSFPKDVSKYYSSKENLHNLYLIINELLVHYKVHTLLTIQQESVITEEDISVEFRCETGVNDYIIYVKINRLDSQYSKQWSFPLKQAKDGKKYIELRRHCDDKKGEYYWHDFYYNGIRPVIHIKFSDESKEGVSNNRCNEKKNHMDEPHDDKNNNVNLKGDNKNSENNNFEDAKADEEKGDEIDPDNDVFAPVGNNNNSVNKKPKPYKESKLKGFETFYLYKNSDVPGLFFANDDIIKNLLGICDKLLYSHTIDGSCHVPLQDILFIKNYLWFLFAKFSAIYDVTPTNTSEYKLTLNNAFACHLLQELESLCGKNDNDDNKKQAIFSDNKDYSKEYKDKYKTGKVNHVNIDCQIIQNCITLPSKYEANNKLNFKNFQKLITSYIEQDNILAQAYDDALPEELKNSLRGKNINADYKSIPKKKFESANSYLKFVFCYQKVFYWIIMNYFAIRCIEFEKILEYWRNMDEDKEIENQNLTRFLGKNGFEVFAYFIRKVSINCAKSKKELIAHLGEQWRADLFKNYNININNNDNNADDEKKEAVASNDSSNDEGNEGTDYGSSSDDDPTDQDTPSDNGVIPEINIEEKKEDEYVEINSENKQESKFDVDVEAECYFAQLNIAIKRYQQGRLNPTIDNFLEYADSHGFLKTESIYCGCFIRYLEEQCYTYGKDEGSGGKYGNNDWDHMCDPQDGLSDDKQHVIDAFTEYCLENKINADTLQEDRNRINQFNNDKSDKKDYNCSIESNQNLVGFFNTNRNKGANSASEGGDEADDAFEDIVPNNNNNDVALDGKTVQF